MSVSQKSPSINTSICAYIKRASQKESLSMASNDSLVLVLVLVLALALALALSLSLSLSLSHTHTHTHIHTRLGCHRLLLHLFREPARHRVSAVCLGP